jgi:beta-ureidopropionase / N-carbamoyl-L-amino-acid hydrolase
VREYRDAAGVTFADAARAAGIDPAGLGPVPWAAQAACFVELHVEQGRALAGLGQPVAIATTILAHGRWALAFTGQGNHAGTTAMAGRRDPAAAAARTVLAARDLALAADPAPDDNSKMRGGAVHGHAVPGHAVPGRAVAARATVGQAELIPGGANVIASRATLSLDCRAHDDAALAALVAAIAGAAEQSATAEGCTFTMSQASLSPLVVFDAALRDTVAALLPDAPLLATGAGHDAGILAALIPTAMLFVRNPSGVSHAPDEGASDEDCRSGVGALTTVLRHLLAGGRAGPRPAEPR